MKKKEWHEINNIKVRVNATKLLKIKTYNRYDPEYWLSHEWLEVTEYLFIFYLEDGKLVAELQDARRKETLDFVEGKAALSYLVDLLKAYNVPIKVE